MKKRLPEPASKPSNEIINVAITQMACSPDPQANLHRQAQLIEQAAKSGAQIICTQELFRSQYFCQLEDHRFFKLAEPIPGPSTDAFCKLAKKHKAVVIASLFERRAAGLYHNTAAVIDADGSILGIYRKMHIPDDPLYYEKFYFTPGDTGFRAWDTAYAHDRRADLLGPVVPGRRPPHRHPGSADPVLSNGDRLAPIGEGRVRPRPARFVGADPAIPRGGQRVLRLRPKPHRP